MTVSIAFAISQRSWGNRWGGYLSDHGPYSVLAVLAEVRGALDSDWRVLVVDASSPLLDLTAEAHRAHRGVVAVIDPDDPADKEKAVRADADDMLEVESSPTEFVRVVTAVLRDLPAPTRPARVRPRVRPQTAETAPKRTGAQRIVVGGPPGSDPEAVALGLAAALGKRGDLTLLIDANDTCPSVAQLLDLPLLPNLASAVDVLRSDTPLGGDLLHDAGRFWVLGGCDPSKWPDVGTATATVVRSYATGCQRVVSIVGPVLDDLGRWGADRYGTSRSLLADADVIVAVGVGDPRGIARLTAWVADARSVARETPLYIVASRSPADRHRRSAVAEQLDLIGAPAGVVVLPPEDRRAAQAAWDGELRRGGKTAKALAKLATTVAPKGAVR